MANLAIKGHATRGREVIELLEMLGGCNPYNSSADEVYECYFISKLKNICSDKEEALDDIKCFTLEQFLEKYPYKVGDKVKTKVLDFIGTIINMRWVNNENTIVYEVEWNDDTKSKLTYYSNGLQPYTEQKEESMKETENSVVVNNEHKQLKVHSLRHDKVQLMIDDKYELKQEGNAYYIVKKQHQYPKTYEECCEIMDLDKGLTLFYGNYDCTPIHITEYSGALEQLLNKFMQLRICRDAYWKIAGEQMGLDKTWEPECEKKRFVIYRYMNDKITKGLDCEECIYRHFLEFPTEEMRDAFYENFNEPIEECKELLG